MNFESSERLLYSSSFTAGAAAYAEHRPDFAEAAVPWALESVSGPRVPDLTAGAGKLRALLSRADAEHRNPSTRSRDAGRAFDARRCRPAKLAYIMKSRGLPSCFCPNLDRMGVPAR